jgi:hypothetical protein
MGKREKEEAGKTKEARRIRLRRGERGGYWVWWIEMEAGGKKIGICGMGKNLGKGKSIWDYALRNLEKIKRRDEESRLKGKKRRRSRLREAIMGNGIRSMEDVWALCDEADYSWYLGREEAEAGVRSKVNEMKAEGIEVAGRIKGRRKR